MPWSRMEIRIAYITHARPCADAMLHDPDDALS
jgi:hypothetical protein